MQEESGYSACTPEDFLDQEGIDYRRTSGSRGAQFNIRECPTCGGTGYKVYLAVDTGYGNCFHGSCGVSYNLWTFAKAHMGTTDAAAIHRRFDEIAKTIGWKPKPKKAKPVVPVFEGSLRLPVSIPIPTASGNNIPYLADRGVSTRLAGDFGLRHCIDGAFRFKREDGTDGRMVFSGRIIIPIYDLDGTLVTFQGRDITGEHDQKYLFPPRLPSTARFVYNGHRAFAEKWSHLVMGEGAFDTIAIQAAIEGDYTFTGMGAVGSFGKKLTLSFEPGMPTQLQAMLALKANGVKVITILWDGEKSAAVAAATAAKQLTKYGFIARIGFLPKGKDPAEVAPATVRKAIATALPYSKTLDVKIRLRNPYGR